MALRCLLTSPIFAAELNPSPVSVDPAPPSEFLEERPPKSPSTPFRRAVQNKPLAEI